MTASIFLDFSLPNAASWFYFSVALSVALFFKFTRLLSIRNWDVLTLFLLVPGFLLFQEARPLLTYADEPTEDLRRLYALGQRLVGYGYLWLLAGSLYFLVRCFVDLTLVRRPPLAPNIDFSGMAWLAVSLFVCLVAVALRPPAGASLNPTDAETVRLWTERVVALAGHLLVVVGLVLVGAVHFGDTTAGMAAATFYLLLPYTAFHIADPAHVLPAVFFVWAAVAYRTPTVSGLLLGAAAGGLLFPTLALPAWASFYRGKGSCRFLAAAGVGAALAALAAWGIGVADSVLAQHLRLTPVLSGWEPWRVPTAEGFWTWSGAHWAYRLPLFVVSVALAVITALWPTPKTLAHLLALTAALLISAQFWIADRGGAFVLWYLPLLLLLAFRPNLTDRTAAAIDPERDWLARLSRAAGRLVRRPAPAQRRLAQVG